MEKMGDEMRWGMKMMVDDDINTIISTI